MLRQPPVELVLVSDGSTSEFDAVLAKIFLPRRIFARHDFSTGDQPPFPALVGKQLIDGKSALYICHNFACRKPVVDPEQVIAALE